jgi:transposase
LKNGGNRERETESLYCDICGAQAQLRRVSGGKFWCIACGHLQS